MTSTEFIESVNAKYFAGELSPLQIALLQDLDPNNTEAVEFVEHAMARMKRIEVSAKDSAALLFWEMASIWPNILPGAWQGIVPPITFSNRHILLEYYMEKNQWCPLTPGSQVLDMGCGFPPLTAIDLAKRFPEVTIIGADLSFGKYTLSDPDDNYACILADETIKYLQPASGKTNQWRRIFEDLNAARHQFAEKFLELKRDLPEKEKENDFEEVLRDGWSLVRNPMRKYARQNLSFIEKAIGDDVFSTSLDMIRCMNVLLYFDPAFRIRALDWASRHLKEGGLFFCGLNWSESINSRISVYQKEQGIMQLKEFSFATENIRPMEGVPYFSFRDDDFDQEQLLQHVDMIRKDKPFMDKLNPGFDTILSQNAVCGRDEAGYLGFPDPAFSPQQLLINMSRSCAQLSQQFAEKAVAVLKELGKKAWVNEIGFISVGIAEEG